MVDFWPTYKEQVKKNCVVYTCLTMGFAVSRALALTFDFYKEQGDPLANITMQGFACWSVAVVLIVPAIATYFKVRDSQSTTY